MRWNESTYNYSFLRNCIMVGKVLLVLLFGIIYEVSCGGPLQLDPLVKPERETIGQRPSISVASVRLPQAVKPSHYDLEIRPIVSLPLDDPEQFTAPGKVTIRILCVSSTSNITLHSEELVIDENGVTVTAVENSVSVPVTGHTYDPPLSFYTINLETSLMTGQEYDLVIPFVAKVGDRLVGLYRSSYVDGEGNTRWLATTQFQAISARMAFPCFDEPNLRATFNITIGRPVEYHSLCNSKKIDTIPNEDLEGWEWDIYDKTVSMPPYLVAIIVSDLVSFPAPEGTSNYDVKVWGPPTMTNASTTAFSTKATAEVLAFLENYLDSPFQFPKLDSAAVPDFAYGAMENWALNVYRLVYLLWFEGESTQFQQLLQSVYIGHEVAHHWFGDLVTCDWWNDIWLNEGFAQYMELIGAHTALPTAGILDRYVIDDVQLAMDFDSGPNTEPLRSDETSLVTDTPSRIIYEKGASVVRMMRGFLGEESFISGIKTYLKKYAYANVVQDQLFAEMDEQVRNDGSWTESFTVKDVMETWTLQSGFPAITLRHAGGSVIYITQERFRRSRNLDLNANSSLLWYVPISYATKENPNFSHENWKPKFWIDKYTLSIAKSIGNSAQDWIVLNPEANGYYRVFYDSYFFTKITDQLLQDHAVIGVSSRSQIIDDYFKGSFAGYVSLQDALELTNYLSRETENTVWTTLFNNLRPINTLMTDSPSYELFKQHFLGKVSSALDLIGWEGGESDGSVDIMLRSQLLDWACSFDDSEKCDDLTLSYITALAEEGQGIPADYQPMIYCNAVSFADTITTLINIREHIDGMYQSASRTDRLTLFANARACEASDSVEMFMDETTSGSSIYTRAHRIQMIQRLAANPANRENVISYLEGNMTPMIDNLGESVISGVISSMSAYTTDATVSTKLNDLINLALGLVTEEAVQQSLESSRRQLAENSEWFRNYGTLIENWLEI